MGRKASVIILTPEERVYLEIQICTRTIQAQTVCRARNAKITDAEKAWIINIACQKPADFGYAAETWTYAKLISHINKTAEEAGYTRLSTVQKSTVHTILVEAEIKPFRIKYYCKNCDPEFDDKMHNVLLVYKQLSMQFDEDGKRVCIRSRMAVDRLRQ